jgi:hypothetical protein
MPDLRPGYNLIRMTASHGEKAPLCRLEPRGLLILRDAAKMPPHGDEYTELKGLTDV